MLPVEPQTENGNQDLDTVFLRLDRPVVSTPCPYPQLPPFISVRVLRHHRPTDYTVKPPEVAVEVLSRCISERA